MMTEPSMALRLPNFRGETVLEPMTPGRIGDMLIPQL
jgi:hypothetical protein